MVVKTQQRKIVLCCGPNTFNTIKWTWMSRQKDREELSLKKLSIFLGNVGTVVVHNEHSTFTSSILALYFQQHLFKEFLEFGGICWAPFHENSIVETIRRNSTINCDILWVVVDLDFNWVISWRPCLFNSACLCSKTGFIAIYDRVLFIHYLC